MAEKYEITFKGITYSISGDITASEAQDYIEQYVLGDLDPTQYMDELTISVVDIPSISDMIPAESPWPVGVAETEVVLDYKKVSSYI